MTSTAVSPNPYASPRMIPADPRDRAPRPVPVLGDMGYCTLPAGVTEEERHRYWTGFAAGERKFRKSTTVPAPVIAHTTTGPAGGWGHYGPRPGSPAAVAQGDQLAAMGRAWRMALHPVAHAAGIGELRAFLTARGDEGRASELVDPVTGTPVGLGKRAAARRRARAAVPVSKALAAAMRTGEVTYATVAEEDRGPVILPAAPVAPAAPAPVLPELGGRVHILHVVAAPVDVDDTPAAGEDLEPGELSGKPRRRSVFHECQTHKGRMGKGKRRAANYLEGGTGGACATGDPCRVWPGVDYYAPDICHGEHQLTWTGAGDPAPVDVDDTAAGAPWPSEGDRAAVADIVAGGGRVERVIGCGDPLDDPVAVAIAGATIPDPARGRRAARRALAAAMRAAGIAPAGDDWSRACQLAGILADGGAA